MKEVEQTPDQQNLLAAKNAMARFFKGKPYYIQKDGVDQPIPDDVLYEDKNIRIAATCFDYGWAMGLIDEHVKHHVDSGKQLRLHPIKNKDDETALNMYLVNEFKTHLVLKEFQAGMSLLYMWLCEGVIFKNNEGSKNEKKEGNNEGRSRRATPVGS